MSYLNLVVACALVGVSLGINTWELPEGDQLWQRLDRQRDGDWMFFKKAYNRTYEHPSEEVSRLVKQTIS